jgi:hypothetical protein
MTRLVGLLAAAVLVPRPSAAAPSPFLSSAPLPDQDEAANVAALSSALSAAGIVPLDDGSDNGAPSPPPPRPFWPLEWAGKSMSPWHAPTHSSTSPPTPFSTSAATLTQLNSTSNQTGLVNYAYSLTHNGTATSVLNVPAGQVYETFDFFWAHTSFTVYGAPPSNLHCLETPLPGSLFVPDVQNFAYNGTQTVNGQTIWVWLRPPYAYGTQRTKAQLPVVWVDGATGTITFFSAIETFSPPNLWPPGQWMVPDPCPTRSSE